MTDGVIEALVNGTPLTSVIKFEEFAEDYINIVRVSATMGVSGVNLCIY